MQAASSELLLEVRDLRVSFGRPGRRTTVVKGLSFSVRRGETVAIVGESGSGKSVSSLAIAGLLGRGFRGRNEEVNGQIMFARRGQSPVDLARLDDHAIRKVQGAEIAMIFQEPMTSLNPVLRIGEQIAENIIEHKHLSRAAAWKHAETMLSRVGIPDAQRRLRSYPHELSGGMRQRVMIAIALSCEPALLIADEPTTALDVTIQAQILDLVADLKSETGAAVLFITHDLAVVSQIADRVIVMYAGHIVEQGPTEEVISRPLHPYTRGLMECVPRVEIGAAPLRELQPIPGLVADPAQPPSGCPFHPRCGHSLAGTCDAQLPQMEQPAADRHVRCFRWRELLEATA